MKKAIVPVTVVFVVIAAICAVLFFGSEAASKHTADFEYDGFSAVATVSGTKINIHGQGRGISLDSFDDSKELSVFLKNKTELTDTVLSNRMVDKTGENGSFDYNYYFGLGDDGKPVEVDLSQIDYVIFDGVKVDIG